MQYSIPSDLRVIDLNADGFADRIYAFLEDADGIHLNDTWEHVTDAFDIEDEGSIADAELLYMKSRRQMAKDIDRWRVLAGQAERALQKGLDGLDRRWDRLNYSR